MPRQNYGQLANLDPDPIMQRLQRGQSLRQIAKDLGVSNVGLRAWLLREDREQYYDAITAALVQRVTEADQRLDQATDQLQVSIAREQCRYSRMDLERRRPNLYGQRPVVSVSGSGISVNVVSYSVPETERETERVLEHDPGADIDSTGSA